MENMLFCIGFLSIVISMIAAVFSLLRQDPISNFKVVYKYGVTLLIGIILIIVAARMPDSDANPDQGKLDIKPGIEVALGGQ